MINVTRRTAIGMLSAVAVPCAAAITHSQQSDTPTLVEGTEAEYAQAFREYCQANENVNAMPDPLHGDVMSTAQGADLEYWLARFWAAPVRSLDELRAKIRLIQADTVLSSDLTNCGRIYTSGDKMADTIDVFLMTVMGDPVDLSPTLHQELREIKAREDAEASAEYLAAEKNRDAAAVSEPKYKAFSQVPDHLVPTDAAAEIAREEALGHELFQEAMKRMQRASGLQKQILAAANAGEVLS